MTSSPSRLAAANGSWLVAPQSTVTTSRAPLSGEGGHRLDVGAVAFGHAVGDVDERLAAASPEIFADERRRAGAVDVVVAEDRDLFAALDRDAQARGRGLHVGQDEGVGHQVAQRRVEIALDRLRRDVASREHAGDQFVVAADLTRSPARASPPPRRAAPATAGRAPNAPRRENSFGDPRCRSGRRRVIRIERAMVEPAGRRGRARPLRSANRAQETSSSGLCDCLPDSRSGPEINRSEPGPPETCRIGNPCRRRHDDAPPCRTTPSTRRRVGSAPVGLAMSSKAPSLTATADCSDDVAARRIKRLGCT